MGNSANAQKANWYAAIPSRIEPLSSKPCERKANDFMESRIGVSGIGCTIMMSLHTSIAFVFQGPAEQNPAVKKFRNVTRSPNGILDDDLLQHLANLWFLVHVLV